MTSFKTAEAIATDFSQLAEVVAVTLGGSLATGKADAGSDIDLYVFSRGEIPVASRRNIIEARASHVELDNRWWETEDYWYERATGTKVEVIYRDPYWLETQLSTVLTDYRAQMGYSTSLWHNIVTSNILYDPDDWFAKLQKTATAPYPSELARAIIDENFPLLRGSMAAHPPQIKQAFERGDLKVAFQRVQHILDSYFDILFALNKTLHPGEKRQLDYAKGLGLTPPDMQKDVTSLLNAREPGDVSDILETVIDKLEVLLSQTKSLS